MISEGSDEGNFNNISQNYVFFTVSVISYKWSIFNFSPIPGIILYNTFSTKSVLVNINKHFFKLLDI